MVWFSLFLRVGFSLFMVAISCWFSVRSEISILLLWGRLSKLFRLTKVISIEKFFYSCRCLSFLAPRSSGSLFWWLGRSCIVCILQEIVQLIQLLLLHLVMHFFRLQTLGVTRWTSRNPRPSSNSMRCLFSSHQALNWWYKLRLLPHPSDTQRALAQF